MKLKYRYLKLACGDMACNVDRIVWGIFLSENHAFSVAPARSAKVLPGADYDPYFRFKGGRLIHAHTKLRFNDTDDIRTILSVDEATENLTADDHTPASDHTLASNRRVRFRDPLVE